MDQASRDKIPGNLGSKLAETNEEGTKNNVDELSKLEDVQKK